MPSTNPVIISLRLTRDFGIALSLAQQGATVVLACRNEKRAAKAKDEIMLSCPGAKVEILLLDNSSLESVRMFGKECREKYLTIDILIRNAGISAPPGGKDFSQDELEIMYQTNFLSSFLLTHLLESQLSPTARVVFTTSVTSSSGFIGDDLSLSKATGELESNFHDLSFANKGLFRHGQSKLMHAAFAKALQNRSDTTPDIQRLAFSFEPGLVKTEIFSACSDPFWINPSFWILSHMMPYTGIDKSQGAATGVHLATSDQPRVLASRGRYFDRMKARVHWV